MLTLPVLQLMAKVDLPMPVETPSSVPGMLGKDVLLILSTSIPIMLFLVGLVIYKKKRKDARAASKLAPRVANLDDDDDDDGASANQRKRKRRRRRREHRPRNPTLAQTGGLPPVRSENSAGPTP